MTTPVRIDGADISHHQRGPLDLDAAKAAGVKFLYHKASEGSDWTDLLYSRRRTQAARSALPYGGYHFARPDGQDAKAEARHFIETAAPRPGDLRPCLDLETNDGHLSPDRLARWANSFSREVAELTGVLPVLYTPYDIGLEGQTMWRPRYGDTNKEPVYGWDIWQFSNGILGVPDRVAGLGHVDLNTLDDDIDVTDLLIAPPHTGPLRFTTQNIQSKPPMVQADVIADVNLTASESTVIGWQEIHSPRYRRAIDNLDPDRYATYWPDPEPVAWNTPITWRTTVFTFKRGGTGLLDNGAGSIRPHYHSWVVLTHNGTGTDILVDNAHYVYGAFSPSTEPDEELRKPLWRQANRVHNRWVDAQRRAHPNRPIIGLGDYNRPLRLNPQPITAPGVLYAVGPASIDHIWMLDGAAWTWDLKDTDRLTGRNSDHPGRRATTVLTR